MKLLAENVIVIGPDFPLMASPQVILPIARSFRGITIALICASIIGSSAKPLNRPGGKLLRALFLLHTGGFLLGYIFARILGSETVNCRTISIEVGMQN